jgi:hypothetical protein
MAVWDGTIWGTSFATVPSRQLGFTDIVPVLLVQPLDPNYNAPFFTRAAVVPLVPEPCFGALVLVGMATLYGRAHAVRGRCSTRAKPTR